MWFVWLIISNLRKLRWSTRDLVENSEVFAHSLGLEDTPALQKKTIGKMGLKVWSFSFTFL
jgi:hypothetical protein